MTSQKAVVDRFIPTKNRKYSSSGNLIQTELIKSRLAMW